MQSGSQHATLHLSYSDISSGSIKSIPEMMHCVMVSLSSWLHFFLLIRVVGGI